MAKYYVTYGNIYDQANCYSVVEADNYNAAREIAHEVTGGRFAFMYDSAGFEGQAERYGLVEIPLQAQTETWEDSEDPDDETEDTEDLEDTLEGAFE